MICGHGSQRAALRAALVSGRAPHALILSGPRQVGKTTLARGLARALLCESPVEGDACEQCVACRLFTTGAHPDFEAVRAVLIRDRSGPGDQDAPRGRYDPAPEAMTSAVLPIDLIRPLRERASRRALRGGRKVVLIAGADRLTDEAQDALLKTIEEPIAGMTVLLVAENLERLHATIRSRCWTLPLGLVPDDDLAHWLTEAHGLARAEARALAARAEGRPGAAWRRWHKPELRALHHRLDELARMLDGYPPVMALRHAEQFEKLARELFEAECASDPQPVVLAAGHVTKVQRSANIHLIDELAARMGRRQDAARLDALLEAKHHLLRNANLRLTLDVLFLRCAGT